jgi:hypothetical protein
LPERRRMKWLETECPEVQAYESRIPVLVLEGAEQESEPPIVALKRVTTVEQRGGRKVET